MDAGASAAGARGVAAGKGGAARDQKRPAALPLAASFGFLYLAQARLRSRPPGARLKKACATMDVKARLAMRVADLRRARRLTQTQLAKRLKTTQQAVSDLETYKHPNLTLGTLQKIALALNSRLIVELK